MKTVLLICFLLLNDAKCTYTTTWVYVCDSRNSKRYHLKEKCRGLRNCSYRTLKIPLEQARKEGKILCKWED
jgi:hypothetical protein